MTLTAHVSARERVSHIKHEAARREPQVRTPPSKTARLHEAIGDSLIPCLTVEESRRRGIDLDTAITLRAEHGATRYRKPDATDRCPAISAYVSRTRVGVYGSVRIWDAPRRPWKGFTA